MRRACPNWHTAPHDRAPRGMPTQAQLRSTATPGSTPSSEAARASAGPMGSCPPTQTHRGDVAAGGQMAMAAA
eukprot:385788-Alexandrium_andersonii.AAC.1